jgi:hypothetical protein
LFREKKDAGYNVFVVNGWNGYHRKERLRSHVGEVGGCRCFTTDSLSRGYPGVKVGYRADRSFFRAFLEIGIILFIIISCVV